MSHDSRRARTRQSYFVFVFTFLSSAESSHAPTGALSDTGVISCPSLSPQRHLRHQNAVQPSQVHQAQDRQVLYRGMYRHSRKPPFYRPTLPRSPHAPLLPTPPWPFLAVKSREHVGVAQFPRPTALSRLHPLRPTNTRRQSADFCFLFLVTLTQRWTKHGCIGGFTPPNHVQGG